MDTLGLKWFGDYETNQDQHGSPLYIDGVIYVSTARNVVLGLRRRRRGKPLWTLQPDAFAASACATTWGS